MNQVKDRQEGFILSSLYPMPEDSPIHDSVITRVILGRDNLSSATLLFLLIPSVNTRPLGVAHVRNRLKRFPTSSHYSFIDRFCRQAWLFLGLIGIRSCFNEKKPVTPLVLYSQKRTPKTAEYRCRH